MRLFAKICLVPSGLVSLCLYSAISNCSADNWQAQVVDGEQLYQQCTGCHAPNNNRTGPKHCGVIGRRAGTLANYEFSPAMRAATIVWTAATLDQFLQSPLTFIPGNRMTIAGIKDASQRRALIMYLTQLNDSNELCH